MSKTWAKMAKTDGSLSRKWARRERQGPSEDGSGRVILGTRGKASVVNVAVGEGGDEVDGPNKRDGTEPSR